MSFEELSARMRNDWDARARENAKFYIADSDRNWTQEDFYLSGHRTVAEEILTDMINICQDKDPAAMRVLEIGCGAGRVTSALARQPGALFKFEVQVNPRVLSAPLDTWLGVPFAPEQANAMAERCGSEPRYSVGAGQERFWHWFFKR